MKEGCSAMLIENRNIMTDTGGRTTFTSDGEVTNGQKIPFKRGPTVERSKSASAVRVPRKHM